MNRKSVVMGVTVLTLLLTTGVPVFAETSTDATRIEKLEERVRDVEARLAKVEASAHKQMGMMQHGHDMMNNGMQHGKDMMDKGMNNPMGQAPQQNPGMGNGMPQGSSQPQGMQGGGMGDM